MDASKIRDPQTENTGIAFLNYTKGANTHPDIVGKLKLQDGKIVELALFAGKTNGTLKDLGNAKYFGVRIRELEHKEEQQ